MTKRLWTRLVVTTGLGAFLAAGATFAQDKPETEALPIKFPKPAYIGTPKKLPDTLKNLEPPSEKLREPFLAPKGCTNLAAKKPVTSSDPWPIIGKLDLVTDGDKEGMDGSWVELAPGKQWVQIDLGQQAAIYAMVVWHMHADPRVYKSVVVQVSDDATFSKGVQTVYNNDQDNSVGQGVGKDPLYYENNQGRLMDAKGVKGRYVRLYSNGSTNDDQNHYTEVEVWGLPAK
jgi:hypothetical protein